MNLYTFSRRALDDAHLPNDFPGVTFSFTTFCSI